MDLRRCRRAAKQDGSDKLELTRRWIEARDYKPARWLAEQAQVDAELASMKAMGARGRP